MKTGRVFLVGAGPGDPELITLKARRLLESADLVVHDRLVGGRVLTYATDSATLVDVGKIPGQDPSRQQEINRLLVSEAKQGRQVVRLKGGDPFVFGRGGEEAEALGAAGVPFEIVPGVTSAIAAPAYAGIPVTHRRLASSFTVVTGNEDPSKDNSAVEWEHLAKAGGTLVVLMGWSNIASIAETLVRHGRGGDTPVALVRWGTEPYQQTIVGTLSDIAEKATQAGLAPPVVAVIGEVVSLRGTLSWFESRPLVGKRALVTRTRTQASALSNLLALHGALPLELPTIEILSPGDHGEIDGALRALGEYDWTVFTSTNAVQAVFDRMAELNLDARAFHGALVAAIGPATAASLAEHGIRVDLVPETFVSEALAGALKGRGVQGRNILLPRADIAGDVLTNSLTAGGANVHEIVSYRTVTPKDSQDRIADILADGVDIATFTSSSTVTNLLDLLDGSLDRISGAVVACIGPVTAATAREKGMKVDIVASEHTIQGLVEAIEAHFSDRG